MRCYCVMPDCLPEEHARVPVSIAEVFVDVHVNGCVDDRLRFLTAMFFARCRRRLLANPRRRCGGGRGIRRQVDSLRECHAAGSVTMYMFCLSRQEYDGAQVADVLFIFRENVLSIV